MMGVTVEAGEKLLCCSRGGRIRMAATKEFSELCQFCDLLLSKLRFSFRSLKRAKQPIGWQD